MPTRPSPRSERLGTPNTPAIRFTRGSSFEASLVRHCYGLSGCSPPWTDLTEFPRPPGAFTSRLPAGRLPFPPLDMTTTASGLLCWRDFHPQEWQLASLHQIHPGHPNSHPELSPTAGRLSPASWGRVRWEHGGGDIPRSRFSSWSMNRFGRCGLVLRRLRPQPMEVVARVLTFENGFAVQHDAFSRHCPERTPPSSSDRDGSTAARARHPCAR